MLRQSSVDDDVQSIEVQAMSDALCTLEGWAFGLEQARNEVTIPSDFAGPAGTSQLVCAKLLHCVRLAWRLKGGGSALCQVIISSLRVCLPAFMVGDVVQQFQDTGVPMLPSPSSIQRHRLILDVSLMLARQEECENHAKYVRYGWADSSPTKGYDMLWIQNHAIAVGTVVATYQASFELTRLLRDVVELTIEREAGLIDGTP